MTPSEDDVTNFLAFAPEAGEGKAFLFLEVSHPKTPRVALDMGFTDTSCEGSDYLRGSCWSIL
jgi:hypothetical protein